MIFPLRWSRPAAFFLCSSVLLLGESNRASALDVTGTSKPEEAPPVSAEATSFDEVAARLDRGGSFYLYLSASQWLNDLSQKVLGWRDLAISASAPKTDADRERMKQAFNLAATLIKQSGVEAITGVGSSCLALEPGVYRNTFFVHHDKGKETGLLNTLLGTAPHALTALDLLPANTALASYCDYDLAGLLKTLRETLEHSGIPEVKGGVSTALAQFSMLTGMSFDDFLKSLGGSGGIILTLDPTRQIEVPMGQAQKHQTIPLPRLALILEVNDDRIFQRVDQSFGGLPGIVKVDEPDLRMRTMLLPALPKITVRATVAQCNRLLVLATDDQLVRDIIAARTSGQGFKASPVFAKLSAGVPAEGNGFGLITQGFVDTLQKFQGGMFDQQTGSTPEQAALMRKVLLAQGGGASYGVSAHVENGWLSVSKGTRSVNQVLVPLALVPIGIGAGMALPVYNSLQQKDKATKSEAQVKQIVVACKLYAGDNDGLYPDALEALIPTYVKDKNLFVSPFAPEEPMGYSLTAGLNGTSPGSAVLVEDKFSKREHQRVFAHVDGSASVERAQ